VNKQNALSITLFALPMENGQEQKELTREDIQEMWESIRLPDGIVTTTRYLGKVLLKTELSSFI